MKTRTDVLAEYQRLGLPKKFCTVPFTTVLLEPDGLVGGCRQKGCDEFPMGDLNTQTLDEIWNGEKFQKWRQEFLDGDPVSCAEEVQSYQCHSCPEYNSLLPDVDKKAIQSKKPSRIAFNFNGKCNLECQMCHVWQKPNGFYDKMGIWDQLDSYITDLKEVELLSGEPFIQKDTYRLIDVISQKKPEAKWIITTNANWKLTDYIKSKLDKISFRNLIVSLDSLVPENYMKIRKKGNLKKALETLRDIQAYEASRIQRGLSPLNIRINFLVQKDNWRELGSFYDFKQEYGVEIFRTFLYRPFEHSILSLSDSDREDILAFYKTHLPAEKLPTRVVLPILNSVNPVIKAQFLSHMLFDLSKS